MDRHADAYVEKTKYPQKEILQIVRRIFQETFPNCEERMAWGVVTFASGKFYIAAMKSCVHVGFTVTGLSENEKYVRGKRQNNETHKDPHFRKY